MIATNDESDANMMPRIYTHERGHTVQRTARDRHMRSDSVQACATLPWSWLARPSASHTPRTPTTPPESQSAHRGTLVEYSAGQGSLRMHKHTRAMRLRLCSVHARGRTRGPPTAPHTATSPGASPGAPSYGPP